MDIGKIQMTKNNEQQLNYIGSQFVNLLNDIYKLNVEFNKVYQVKFEFEYRQDGQVIGFRVNKVKLRRK